MALGLTYSFIAYKHGGLGTSILTWLINEHVCVEPLSHASPQATFREDKDGRDDISAFSQLTV